MSKPDINVQAMISAIIKSKKYRNAGLNPNTIRDLIAQESQKFTSQKALQKSVRRKLHNIVAPYLGEPNYVSLSNRLSTIDPLSLDSTELKQFCLDVMSEHSSTAERLPNMATFYEQLFQVTGKPDTILDLACGLHPFAFPWMGLPETTQYYAYDIIQPRVDLINQFFAQVGSSPLAQNRDILVSPPEQLADLAFFFKEAHRFEKRQPGCNRAFWANLNVDTLAVSLPVEDLSGTHSLLDQHRNLVDENLPENQGVVEIVFKNEVIFLIKKPGR